MAILYYSLLIVFKMHITEVYISDSNIEMEAYAFYDAGKDMSIKIVNYTGLLDEKAFQSSKTESLAINDSTLELRENVFSYCEDLTDVIIGASSIEIGDSAFLYCEELVSVEIKGTLSDMGKYVFYDCQEELVITYDGGKYNEESIEDVR